jgi:hypothetical protein
MIFALTQLLFYTVLLTTGVAIVTSLGEEQWEAACPLA